ncbi:serine hydroxymethyltransferase [Candidatus Mycoplasma mahonii]|uniref:serine hydroxymethyltransferase n=1 Tax=Candidatus Mycoplasma mahonii TaxID=3004105 RepID=UPI0026F0FC09|nr:serine hydroxymethyltransferase [Candidatus Mycoplasma mahonii]WKX02815.1 serine hydroxymethyltransferase [Candidatus Mycoplasma mahonii]
MKRGAMIQLNDKKIMDSINKEKQRQSEHIELIASENFVSEDILKAVGSILTNKYSEGYPGKRYYDGCEFVDQIEQVAIDRAKKLFHVEFVNVQAHSGSSANAAAIAAMIEPGEKILGASLDAGGHLTHGYHINFSGKFYEAVSYGVDDNGFLNYDDILAIAKKEKPQLIICGYSAYSRKIDFKKFREIADIVGAKLMADIAHIAGIIAVGEHESPVKYADIITSTTHKTLRGARGGIIMTNNQEVAKQVNRWIFPGYQGGPLMHVVAGKAITFFEALKPEFKIYIKQLLENAKAFADEFVKLGVPVVSGGTDNHMFTINVWKHMRITGKEASDIMQKNNITVNKNTVPNDTKSPMVTSGVRLGTAAMTTKGFNEKDFRELARLMVMAIKDNKDIKKDVTKLLQQYF